MSAVGGRRDYLKIEDEVAGIVYQCKLITDEDKGSGFRNQKTTSYKYGLLLVPQISMQQVGLAWTGFQ